MCLEKPDPNKQAFKVVPDAPEAIRRDRCPFCGKVINSGDPIDLEIGAEDISSPFRNETSRREYSMSGLCQDCQDEVFGVD